MSPSADVLSVVAMKYAILLKRSHTTRMVLYPWANGSLVMKSADIWLHCYESPKKEQVSHTFKHLVANIKLYNADKI